MNRWSSPTSGLFPPGVVNRDGFEDQRVACRLGILQLHRQVCFNRWIDKHVMPGNAILPKHHGTIITRGLQEWACLLPLDLPFATVDRLLKWQTRSSEMICASEARRLVGAHGEAIRAAEAREVEELLAKEDLNGIKPALAPQTNRRYAAGWPEELTEAVALALERGDAQPPEGVKGCDWERVLTARAQEQLSAQQLRKLGPEVKPDQVVAATDDVLVRRPEKGRTLSIRTARVATADGFRYLSGTGEAVLNQLLVLLILCGAHTKTVLLLGDGAKWIRNFFLQRMQGFARKELILDWYHLKKKCYDFCSMISKSKKAKASLLGGLLTMLWQGRVEEAIALLEASRPECRNEQRLDELIGYFAARQPYIPDYKARRADRLYIGSAHAEKANDLIVARRQKHKGMHWSEKTADGLAALKTLTLNRGWDPYWNDRKVLPLAAGA